MSRNYKFRNQEIPHFVTFATVNWIDALTRSNYKEIILDSLNYCISNKGLKVYAWVIMSNHVHLIIGTNKDAMENIMRDLKRYTSKTILKAISENPNESRKDWMLWMFERAGQKNSNNLKYQFWQQHNHPIELDNNKIMDQKLDYLHENPVAEGYVIEPHEYKYSSAIDYAGGKGLINIELLQ